MSPIRLNVLAASLAAAILAGCSGGAAPAAPSAAISGASQAPASVANEHMTLIQSTQTSEDIPIWVAEDTGIFARNGLALRPR